MDTRNTEQNKRSFKNLVLSGEMQRSKLQNQFSSWRLLTKWLHLHLSCWLCFFFFFSCSLNSDPRGRTCSLMLFQPHSVSDLILPRGRSQQAPALPTFLFFLSIFALKEPLMRTDTSECAAELFSCAAFYWFARKKWEKWRIHRGNVNDLNLRMLKHLLDVLNNGNTPG